MRDAPTAPNLGSYPGTPLRLGDVSDDVRTIQLRLNRISNNYPAIPKIYPVDGVFDQDTLNAVRKFQEVFQMAPDGIVGKGTWYRIAYLYTAVTQLAELNSEGVRLEDVTGIFPRYLRRGDKGDYVRVLQYYLAAITIFFTGQAIVPIDGDFGPLTEQARADLPGGLRPAGRWYRRPADLGKAQRSLPGFRSALPDWALNAPVTLFPRRLVQGMTGRMCGRYRTGSTSLSTAFPEIQPIAADGNFGPAHDRGTHHRPVAARHHAHGHRGAHHLGHARPRG